MPSYVCVSNFQKNADAHFSVSCVLLFARTHMNITYGNAIHEVRYFVSINTTVLFYVSLLTSFCYFCRALLTLSSSALIRSFMFLQRHKIYCNSQIAANTFCHFGMNEEKNSSFLFTITENRPIYLSWTRENRYQRGLFCLFLPSTI